VDRELEYKLEAFDGRLRLYRSIVKNYQEALIKGIRSHSLRVTTEDWIKDLNGRIKKLERDRTNTIKKWKLQ